MCDLAYAHRLAKADRDQAYAVTLLAAAGGELRDFRAEVEEWLYEDVTPTERDELREALGV